MTARRNRSLERLPKPRSVEVIDGPDSMGRYFFIVDWTDKYGRKHGQAFRTLLPKWAGG